MTTKFFWSKDNCSSTSVYIFFYSLESGAEISKEIIYHCIKRGSSTQYYEATRYIDHKKLDPSQSKQKSVQWNMSMYNVHREWKLNLHFRTINQRTFYIVFCSLSFFVFLLFPLWVFFFYSRPSVIPVGIPIQFFMKNVIKFQ